MFASYFVTTTVHLYFLSGWVISPAVGTPILPSLPLFVYLTMVNHKIYNVSIKLTQQEYVLKSALFFHDRIHLKNSVFWDVTPCGSCKNRRFGGT
jgi:hypothetical protein